MGSIQKPLNVKLFMGIMYHKRMNLKEILQEICEEFGQQDRFLGPVDFEWSHYYEQEMGKDLLKYYTTFSTPIDRDQLPSIKLFTNQLEAKWAKNECRAVNIDPGYIARDKLVLASTKDFYHRLYLSDGIFGEVTLHYRKGVFRYFSWTYPDYKEPKIVNFLEMARADLVHDLRNQG
ncbi:DUF4416 family protein [Chitinispirillales bacterium ANBcel5]|uniref:DUF4416 family protein n=1 Tax=Cellulosispirillum alkaliphilum TaxID=3039283 RepID=UPI002A526C7D|nr:DUF4416 family protein [Chitinispirillales bacterium ANBcel5]